MTTYFSGFLPEHVTPEAVLDYMLSLGLSKCTNGQFSIRPEISATNTIVLICQHGPQASMRNNVACSQFYLLDAKAHYNNVPPNVRLMLSRPIHLSNIPEPFITLINLLYCDVLHHFGVKEYIEDTTDDCIEISETLFGTLVEKTTMNQLHIQLEQCAASKANQLLLAFGHWLQRESWFNNTLPFQYRVA